MKYISFRELLTFYVKIKRKIRDNFSFKRIFVNKKEILKRDNIMSFYELLILNSCMISS